MTRHTEPVEAGPVEMPTHTELVEVEPVEAGPVEIVRHTEPVEVEPVEVGPVEVGPVEMPMHTELVEVELVEVRRRSSNGPQILALALIGAGLSRVLYDHYRGCGVRPAV